MYKMNVYGNIGTSVESPSQDPLYSGESLKRKKLDVKDESVKKPLWMVDILPNAPGNVAVPTNTLSLEVPSVKNLMRKIAKIKASMIQDQKCVICHLVIKGLEVESHTTVNNCHFVKSQGLCFSCLGSSCTKGVKCSIKFPMKLKNPVCFICGIEELLHLKSDPKHGLIRTPYGRHCNSIARDVVFPFIWYSRRLTDSIQQVNTHFNLKHTGDPEYRVWLYKSDHTPPLPNYLAIFAFLINHPLQ